MKAAIISSHRNFAPQGLGGGENGKTGRNYVVRAGSSLVEELGGRDITEMNEGDVFVIETPGAGGFGKRPKRKS